ncbi:XPG/Rad2 endonuclease [Abortiporus biennis]
MGVAGLWDVLRPCETATECARLMSTPFLPLFVFDGPERPNFKRGKRISGKNHWMVQGMQNIIEAFGFQCIFAPGEAEAELAYLNSVGIIDAVLTDDVDTFLFGASMVVRNPSATLSGNKAHPVKNSAGKVDDNHVITYSSQDLQSKIGVTEEDLILIGVLRGGDYHTGVTGCGVTIAHGLAKCGFGKSLVNAARTMGEDKLEDFLVEWRDELRQELKTNSRGLIGRKNPSLAKVVPDDFPNIEVLYSYTSPITSKSKGRKVKDIEAKIDWEKEPDIGKIASLCELYFEWGVKEVIIKRFRTVLWSPAVLRILRRSALLTDKARTPIAYGSNNTPITPKKKGSQQYATEIGTPSKMIAKHFSSLQLDTGMPDDDSDEDEDDENVLVTKIHSSRTHASTDGVLEYRLEIAPAQLVRLAEGGIKGLRQNVNPTFTDSEDEGGDESEGGGGGGKKVLDPESPIRVWMPASMVQIALPRLVEEFEEKQRKKNEKKNAKKTTTKTKSSKTNKAEGSKIAALFEVEISDMEEDIPGPSSSPVQKKSKKQKQPELRGDLDVVDKPEVEETKIGKKKASSSTTLAIASSAKYLDATMNEFFKASKTKRSGGQGTMKPPPVQNISRVSKVAALFDSELFLPATSGTSSSGMVPGKGKESMSSRNGRSSSTQTFMDHFEDRPTKELRPPPPPLPRPFPVSFDDDFMSLKGESSSSSEDRPSVKSKSNSSSNSKLKPKQKSVLSSSSSLSRLTNTKHSKATRIDTIIEISSDSEDGGASGSAVAPSIPPLSKARARTKGKEKMVMKSTSMPVRPVVVARKVDDVIDLTNDDDDD